MDSEARRGRRIQEINILSGISELIIASLLKVLREALCTKSFLHLLSPYTKSSCNYWISAIHCYFKPQLFYRTSARGMRSISLKPNS